MHQDANPRKDKRKRIEQDIAPAYAAAHAGMTVEEATDRLAAQLLRQVDKTAASQGGWDQDALKYLNGLTPQTTNPPPQLGLGAVGGYFAGIGQGLADTIGHPLDTLWGGLKGAYGLVTDPQGTAQQMQETTRDVIIQAGGGDYAPAGRQLGQQVGSTVVGTVAGVGAGKVVAAVKGKADSNAAAHWKNMPQTRWIILSVTGMGAKFQFVELNGKVLTIIAK